MFRFAKRMIVPALVLGLAAAAAGCGQKAAETPAAPPAGVTVTRLDLGRGIGSDKRVTEKVSQFAPNDVIYASVLTAGAASNAVLKARWTYEDGQPVDESEIAIAPTGEAATEFHISKSDGWPTGKYRVEIFLNGASVRSMDFEVK